MKTKPMSAWLIMWEWTGDHAAVEKPYVDILSIRKSVRYVREYVQRLHDIHWTSLRERTATAKYTRPSEPIYPATVHRTRHGIEIHCGHNPFLVARPVKSLTIETDEGTLEEKIYWKPYRDPE